MVSDLDIVRSAAVLIRHHGDAAPIEAAIRADDFLDQGDLIGFALWKRILAAVNELQHSAPTDEDTRH